MAAAGFKSLAIAAALAAASACTSVNFTDKSVNGAWRVTSVSGRAVPDDGTYHMLFDDRRVSARFGCNSMGGAFVIEEQSLRIDGLTSTLMGCPEPAATIESNAAEILNQEMRMTSLGKGLLRLDATAGSIELRR